MVLYKSRKVIESAPSTTASQKSSAATCWATGSAVSASFCAADRAAAIWVSFARCAASSATLGPMCALASTTERATDTSSSPPRKSSRGSRSSPPNLLTSWTVVPPPCLMLTRPAAATRFIASRIAGLDTPSTLANSRSLGRFWPAGRSPLSTPSTICSYTSSGTLRCLIGSNGMARR